MLVDGYNKRLPEIKHKIHKYLNDIEKKSLPVFLDK